MLSKKEIRCRRVGLSCIAMVLVLAMVMLLMVPVFATGTKTNKLKVMVLSDTHLMARQYIADTDDYRTICKVETKSFTDSEAIIDAQLKKAKEIKPDVLLIPGDLTKDGEYENHVILAKKLKALKAALPKLHVYVINGNHDINNENGMLYATADGTAIPATRTSPALFKKAYKDVTYNDKTIIARYTPPKNEVSGQMSYVARIKKGYTLIAVDSGRYSADNTKSGADEHETGGAVSAKLRKWVVQQIKKAKKRGDTIIGMQHHNVIPKFSMEDDINSMFLVNDWESYVNTVADAGLHYFFTGHLHSQDISRWVTDQGNEIFDIETGSSQTYPNPFRVVTFTRTRDDKNIVHESLSGTVVKNLGISYISPLTGKRESVSDVTKYSQNLLYSPEGLSAAVQWLLRDALATAPSGTSDALDELIIDILSIKLDNSKKRTVIDTFNYAYANHLAGSDQRGHQNPGWFNNAVRKIEKGYLVDTFIDVLIRDLSHYGVTVSNAILNDLPLFPALFTAMGIDSDKISHQLLTEIETGTPAPSSLISPTVRSHISNHVANLLDSYNYDTNYQHDNAFLLKNDWQAKKRPYQSAKNNPSRPVGAMDYLVPAVVGEINA